MWSHLFYSIVHFFLTALFPSMFSLACQFEWCHFPKLTSYRLWQPQSCRMQMPMQMPHRPRIPRSLPCPKLPSLISLFFTPVQLFPFIPICMSPFYVSLDIRIEVKSRKVHWHRNSEMGELSLTVIGTQGRKEQKGSFHPVNCVIITAPWAGLHSGFLYCIVVRSFEIF